MNKVFPVTITYKEPKPNFVIYKRKKRKPKRNKGEKMNIEQPASVSPVSVTVNPMDDIENAVEKCCADCSC